MDKIVLTLTLLLILLIIYICKNKKKNIKGGNLSEILNISGKIDSITIKKYILTENFNYNNFELEFTIKRDIKEKIIDLNNGILTIGSNQKNLHNLLIHIRNTELIVGLIGYNTHISFNIKNINNSHMCTFKLIYTYPYINLYVNPSDTTLIKGYINYKGDIKKNKNNDFRLFLHPFKNGFIYIGSTNLLVFENPDTTANLTDGILNIINTSINNIKISHYNRKISDIITLTDNNTNTVVSTDVSLKNIIIIDIKLLSNYKKKINYTLFNFDIFKLTMENNKLYIKKKSDNLEFNLKTIKIKNLYIEIIPFDTKHIFNLYINYDDDTQVFYKKIIKINNFGKDKFTKIIINQLINDKSEPIVKNFILKTEIINEVKNVASKNLTTPNNTNIQNNSITYEFSYNVKLEFIKYTLLEKDIYYNLYSYNSFKNKYILIHSLYVQNTLYNNKKLKINDNNISYKYKLELTDNLFYLEHYTGKKIQNKDGADIVWYFDNINNEFYDYTYYKETGNKLYINNTNNSSNIYLQKKNATEDNIYYIKIKNSYMYFKSSGTDGDIDMKLSTKDKNNLDKDNFLLTDNKLATELIKTKYNVNINNNFYHLKNNNIRFYGIEYPYPKLYIKHNNINMSTQPCSDIYTLPKLIINGKKNIQYRNVNNIIKYQPSKNDKLIVYSIEYIHVNNVNTYNEFYFKSKQASTGVDTSSVTTSESIPTFNDNKLYNIYLNRKTTNMHYFIKVIYTPKYYANPNFMEEVMENSNIIKSIRIPPNTKVSLTHKDSIKLYNQTLNLFNSYDNIDNIIKIPYTMVHIWNWLSTSKNTIIKKTSNKFVVNVTTELKNILGNYIKINTDLNINKVYSNNNGKFQSGNTLDTVIYPSSSITKRIKIIVRKNINVEVKAGSNIEFKIDNTLQILSEVKSNGFNILVLDTTLKYYDFKGINITSVNETEIYDFINGLPDNYIVLIYAQNIVGQLNLNILQSALRLIGSTIIEDEQAKFIGTKNNIKAKTDKIQEKNNKITVLKNLEKTLETVKNFVKIDLGDKYKDTDFDWKNKGYTDIIFHSKNLKEMIILKYTSAISNITNKIDTTNRKLNREYDKFRDKQLFVVGIKHNTLTIKKPLYSHQFTGLDINSSWMEKRIHNITLPPIENTLYKYFNKINTYKRITVQSYGLAAGHASETWLPAWSIFNIDTYEDNSYNNKINSESEEILLPKRGINAVVLDDRLNVVDLSELQISRQYQSDDYADKPNLENKIITIRTISLDDEYLNSNKYYSIDDNKDQLIKKRDFKIGAMKIDLEKSNYLKSNLRLIDILEHPDSYYKFKVTFPDTFGDSISNYALLEAIDNDGNPSGLYLIKKGDALILIKPIIKWEDLKTADESRLFKIMSSYDALNVKLEHKNDSFNSKGINDNYNHDGLVTFESYAKNYMDPEPCYIEHENYDIFVRTHSEDTYGRQIRSRWFIDIVDETKRNFDTLHHERYWYQLFTLMRLLPVNYYILLSVDDEASDKLWALNLYNKNKERFNDYVQDSSPWYEFFNINEMELFYTKDGNIDNFCQDHILFDTYKRNLCWRDSYAGIFQKTSQNYNNTTAKTFEKHGVQLIREKTKGRAIVQIYKSSSLLPKINYPPTRRDYKINLTGTDDFGGQILLNVEHLGKTINVASKKYKDNGIYVLYYNNKIFSERTDSHLPMFNKFKLVDNNYKTMCDNFSNYINTTVKDFNIVYVITKGIELINLNNNALNALNKIGYKELDKIRPIINKKTFEVSVKTKLVANNSTLIQESNAYNLENLFSNLFTNEKIINTLTNEIVALEAKISEKQYAPSSNFQNTYNNYNGGFIGIKSSNMGRILEEKFIPNNITVTTQLNEYVMLDFTSVWSNSIKSINITNLSNKNNINTLGLIYNISKGTVPRPENLPKLESNHFIKNDILILLKRTAFISYTNLKKVISANTNKIDLFINQLQNSEEKIVKNNMFGDKTDNLTNNISWLGNNIIYNYCSYNLAHYQNKFYSHNYNDKTDKYYMMNSLESKDNNEIIISGGNTNTNKYTYNLVSYSSNKNLSNTQPNHNYEVFKNVNNHFILETLDELTNECLINLKVPGNKYLKYITINKLINEKLNNQINKIVNEEFKEAILNRSTIPILYTNDYVIDKKNSTETNNMRVIDYTDKTKICPKSSSDKLQYKYFEYCNNNIKKLLETYFNVSNDDYKLNNISRIFPKYFKFLNKYKNLLNTSNSKVNKVSNNQYRLVDKYVYINELIDSVSEEKKNTLLNIAKNNIKPIYEINENIEQNYNWKLYIESKNNIKNSEIHLYCIYNQKFLLNYNNKLEWSNKKEKNKGWKLIANNGIEGLLDNINNIKLSNNIKFSGAYALKKLFNYYDGPIIQVKTNTTNIKTADIYFDYTGKIYKVHDGSIEYKSITEWTSETVYVEKWYDQSNNNNHINSVSSNIIKKPILYKNVDDNKGEDSNNTYSIYFHETCNDELKIDKFENFNITDNGNQPHTIFCDYVYEKFQNTKDASNLFYICNENTTGSTSKQIAFHPNWNGVSNYYFYNNDIITESALINNDIVTLKYTGYSGLAEKNIYVNNKNVIVSTSAGKNQILELHSTVSFGIGNHKNRDFNNSLQYHGYINTILINNTNMERNDITNIYNLLSTKNETKLNLKTKTELHKLENNYLTNKINEVLMDKLYNYDLFTLINNSKLINLKNMYNNYKNKLETLQKDNINSLNTIGCYLFSTTLKKYLTINKPQILQSELNDTLELNITYTDNKSTRIYIENWDISDTSNILNIGDTIAIYVKIMQHTYYLSTIRSNNKLLWVKRKNFNNNSTKWNIEYNSSTGKLIFDTNKTEHIIKNSILKNEYEKKYYIKNIINKSIKGNIIEKISNKKEFTNVYDAIFYADNNNYICARDYTYITKNDKNGKIVYYDNNYINTHSIVINGYYVMPLDINLINLYLDYNKIKYIIENKSKQLKNKDIFKINLRDAELDSTIPSNIDNENNNKKDVEDYIKNCKPNISKPIKVYFKAKPKTNIGTNKIENNILSSNTNFTLTGSIIKSGWYIILENDSGSKPKYLEALEN